MRVLSLCQQPKQIISYEEFIILYDFLLAQYKRIYVIENAIYWHLYDSRCCFSRAQKPYVAACSGLNAMVEQTPVPSRKPDTGQTCGK